MLGGAEGEERGRAEHSCVDVSFGELMWVLVWMESLVLDSHIRPTTQKQGSLQSGITYYTGQLCCRISGY